MSPLRLNVVILNAIMQSVMALKTYNIRLGLKCLLTFSAKWVTQKNIKSFQEKQKTQGFVEISENWPNLRFCVHPLENHKF
jgi:hypothetical protein